MELPVVTGGMLYPWPTRCPDGSFFFYGPDCGQMCERGSVARRCHHITGAPCLRTAGPGQDHTAFWVMEATSLKRGVREAPSLQPITTTTRTATRNVFVNHYLRNDTSPVRAFCADGNDMGVFGRLSLVAVRAI